MHTITLNYVMTSMLWCRKTDIILMIPLL